MGWSGREGVQGITQNRRTQGQALVHATCATRVADQGGSLPARLVAAFSSWDSSCSACWVGVGAGRVINQGGSCRAGGRRHVRPCKAALRSGGGREAGREAYSPPRRRPGPRSGPSAAAERGPGRPAEGGEREGSKGLGGQPARRGSPLLWRSPARAPLPLCSADQPRLTPACLRPRGGVLATRGLGLAWGGCRTVSGAAEQVAEGCRTRGMARMGRGVATWRLLPEADLPQHAARRFGSLPSCAARFLPAWRRRRSSACTAASGMTP